MYGEAKGFKEQHDTNTDSEKRNDVIVILKKFLGALIRNSLLALFH